jgi:universal stress protein E
MLELNKVTVVIEPDADEQPALGKAKQVAKLADCELELLLAEYNSYLEDGYYFDPAQAQKLRYEHGDRRMEELEALADPLREQGLEVSCTTA